MPHDAFTALLAGEMAQALNRAAVGETSRRKPGGTGNGKNAKRKLENIK